MDLDNISFMDGYVEAAIWSSTDDNEEPLDANYSHDDIAEATLERMQEDCDDFMKHNEADLVASEISMHRAGVLFWLNRNGHGTGFWDEYSPGDERYEASQRLSRACKAYGEAYLMVGEDEMLHGN